MKVIDIQEYSKTGVLKVYLEPLFPESEIVQAYFYVDAEMYDFIKECSLTASFNGYSGLTKDYNIAANIFDRAPKKRPTSLQRWVLLKMLNLTYDELYATEAVDHVNGIKLDNVLGNLKRTTFECNNYNRQIIGYNIATIRGVASKGFKPVYDEVQACQDTYLRRKKYFSKYDYDFFLDRRDELDILDLERTGQISTEEAVYRHVLRHNNAWFYYRFNLAEYYKDNHITLPPYKIDDYGRLVDAVSGRLLCPERTYRHSLFYIGEEIDYAG